MTETADWQQIFDSVKQIPGGTKPTKKKLTEKDLQERNAWLERRRAADIAVAHGMVDDGERDPWAWLSEWSTGIEDTLTEQTAVIATLQEIAAASSTTPLWAADLQDLPSFPRNDLSVLGNVFNAKYLDINAFFSFSCADNSHNHTFKQGACPVFQPEVVISGSVTKGHIYYIPIIIPRNGLPAAVRWIVGADTSIFSIDKYYMALCAYDPATADVVKLWDSGNIKDGVANTTALAEVEIETGLTDPSTDATTPGQLLFVAHQQIAPSILQSARRFAAKALPGIARPGLLLDAACYVAEDYTDGIPSSIPFASLTRENTMLPWASIRMESVPTP